TTNCRRTRHRRSSTRLSAMAFRLFSTAGNPRPPAPKRPRSPRTSIWWRAAAMDEHDPEFMLYVELGADEARAFAQMVKRVRCEDCVILSDRKVVYVRRAEHDVMWAAVQAVQRQFAHAGHAPR